MHHAAGFLGVLSHWGLQDNAIRQVYGTAWQVGEHYILKRYQKEDLLRRNLNLLQRLDQMGIPVGQVVPTREGTLYVSVADGIRTREGTEERTGEGTEERTREGEREQFYFLSKRLPGSHLVKLDAIPETALAMGGVLADLHRAFRKCEDVEGIRDNSLLDEMKGWVRDNLEKGGWKYVAREAYEETVAHLEAVYDRLPVQLIHRDVHFGNFLFSEGMFSGYIDFDLSQRNIRIFDLGYFLLGLLTEEEGLHLSQEQWFAFLENALAGYEEKGEVSEAERKALPYVMECIELLFVAYFEGTGEREYAGDADRIYGFVKQQKDRIREVCKISGFKEIAPHEKRKSEGS